MTTFTHSLAEPDKGHIPFTTDAQPPAVVTLNVDEAGNFSLAANRAGCLHLARVFAEMALRRFPNGYHFHKDAAFQFHAGVSTEFTFILIDEAGP